MKKYAITILVVFLRAAVFGCPACKKQQPKITQGITHGTGPDSSFDYWIIGAMVILTLYVLIISVKYLIKPGEGQATHIKRLILKH